MLNLPRIYSISTNSIPFHCSKYVVPSIDRTGPHLSGFTQGSASSYHDSNGTMTD